MSKQWLYDQLIVDRFRRRPFYTSKLHNTTGYSKMEKNFTEINVKISLGSDNLLLPKYKMKNP